MTREKMKDKLKTSLTGLTIQSFRLVEGGTLILYLGHGVPPLPADQKTTRLWIESAWRICTTDKVVAGVPGQPRIC